MRTTAKQGVRTDASTNNERQRLHTSEGKVELRMTAASEHLKTLARLDARNNSPPNSGPSLPRGMICLQTNAEI